MKKKARWEDVYIKAELNGTCQKKIGSRSVGKYPDVFFSFTLGKSMGSMFKQ
jgi:hypothetical protein